jgi:hypothetical protein
VRYEDDPHTFAIVGACPYPGCTLVASHDGQHEGEPEPRSSGSWAWCFWVIVIIAAIECAYFTLGPQ